MLTATFFFWVALAVAAVAALTLLLQTLGRRRPQLPAPDADGLVRHCDQVYYREAGHDPIRHRLDVFAPGAGRNLPVLLFFHGGGWTFGHKASRLLVRYDRTGTVLAKEGVIVVMANYRLSPWVKFPEHSKDTARAFAWTLRNIKDYGGDPRRIFVGGHSAGGHLAALLALDPSYLASENLSLNAIRGCVVVSGVYRIGHFVSGLANIPVARFFGAMGPVFGTNPDAQEKASPMSFVNKDMVPFLVLYGDSEWYGLDKQALEFLALAQSRRARVESRLIPNRNHVSIMAKMLGERDPTTLAIAEFCRRSN
jgi:acetyl esterase/lipase